jgi:hypothetical protein
VVSFQWSVFSGQFGQLITDYWLLITDNWPLQLRDSAGLVTKFYFVTHRLRQRTFFRAPPSHPGEVELVQTNSQALWLCLYSVVEVLYKGEDVESRSHF